MYLISYSIYICTVAIIHLETYHNLKKKKKHLIIPSLSSHYFLCIDMKLYSFISASSYF